MKKVMILIIASFITNLTYSQFNPGGNTPGSGTGGDTGIPATGAPPASGVPFDGGLSILLIAAGAGLGAKRRKRNV